MIRIRQAEPDICKAILAGMKRKEIADMFEISEATVQNVAKRNGVLLAGNMKARMAENHAEIVKLLESGIGVRDVARKVGFSAGRVYTIARMYDVALKGCEKLSDDNKAKIVAAVKDGAGEKALACMFGVSKTTIAKVVHEAGAEFAYITRDREAQAAKKFESISPGFEYVDGYENYSSVIRVRCRRCGEITSVSYDAASRHPILCKCDAMHECPTCGKMTARREYCSDECRKKAEYIRWREKTRPQREAALAEAKRRRIEQKEARIAEQERRKAERMHACPVCGCMTSRPKYCSKACANRVEHSTKEARRRAKVAAAMVDKDITLEVVWRNGLGVCYICGCVTDWNDKREENGTIICGDRYPSIDHIVPLAKGGKHSWNNCALACRRCNSKKRDTPPPPQMSQNGVNLRLGQPYLSPREI